MLNGITVFNIREYLSAKGDGDLGEDELRKILSDFFVMRIQMQKKFESFTLTIKPIAIRAGNFSNTMKRKIARVSEWDKENSTQTLLAYLIAQLWKNFKDAANRKITGEQLLQAALDTIKELQHMSGGMVIFLEVENKEKQ